MTFFVVYIEEAHPQDSWQLPANVTDGVLFSTPSSLEDREQVAGACVRKLGIEIPALVDRYDDRVERNYTGWPDRLYVIDPQGRVAYKSKPGPYGFHPDEMAASLERVLSPGAGAAK